MAACALLLGCGNGNPERDAGDLDSGAAVDGCAAQAEVCDDGMDNDCDDEIDELPCWTEEGAQRCVPQLDGTPTEGLPKENGTCMAPDNPGCMDEVGVLFDGMDVVVRGQTRGHGNDSGSLRCSDYSLDTEDYLIGLRACDAGFYSLTVVETTGGLANSTFDGVFCPSIGMSRSCQGSFGCTAASRFGLEAGDLITVALDGDNDLGGIFALRIRSVDSL
jgi:hypothetical protein